MTDGRDARESSKLPNLTSHVPVVLMLNRLILLYFLFGCHGRRRIVIVFGLWLSAAQTRRAAGAAPCAPWPRRLAPPPGRTPRTAAGRACRSHRRWSKLPAALAAAVPVPLHQPQLGSSPARGAHTTRSVPSGVACTALLLAECQGRPWALGRGGADSSKRIAGLRCLQGHGHASR